MMIKLLEYPGLLFRLDAVGVGEPMSGFFQIVMFVVALLIVFAVGKLCTARLIGESSRLGQSQIIFPSLVGAAWLICSSVLLNYLGLPVKWVAFLSLVPIGMGLWRMLRCNIFAAVKRDELFAVGCGVLGGLFVLAPLLFWRSFNPYNDTFTYVCIADYLVDHAFLAGIDTEWANAAVTSQIKLYQVNGFRMGMQYLLALFTVIFHREFSLEAYLPVAGVAVFLYIGSLWLFAKVGLRLSPVKSGMAVAFSALHFISVIGPASSGFLPQTIGLSFFVLTIVCLLIMRNEVFSRSQLILAGFGVAGVILAYSEVSPFLFLCGLSLVGHQYLVDRNRASRSFKQYLTAACIGAVFAQYGSVQAFKAILAQMHFLVGWDVSYTLWQYWTQLLSVAPPHFGNIAKVMTNRVAYAGMTFLSLAVAVILCKGLANSKRDQESLIDLAVLGIPFGLLALYFSGIAMNPWQPGLVGQTWSIYKVFQYVFFLVPPALAIFWHSVFCLNLFWRRVSKAMGALLLLLMLSVMSVSIYNQHGPMREFTGNSEDPIQEYFNLREAVKRSGFSEFNIIMPPELQKHRQMVAYFLRDVKLHGNWSGDDYIQQWIAPTERNRAINPQGYSLIVKTGQNSSRGQNIGANMQLAKARIEYWKYAEGWYGPEQDNVGNHWRWADKEAKILLDVSQSQPKRITLEFEYLSDKDVLRISSDVDSIAIQLAGDIWTKISVSLTISSQQLMFVKEHGGVVRPGDPRKLGFAIRNLIIVQADGIIGARGNQ